MPRIIKSHETPLGTLLIVQSGHRHIRHNDDDLGWHDEIYTRKQRVLIMESGTKYTRANARNVIRQYGSRIMLEGGDGQYLDEVRGIGCHDYSLMRSVDPQAFIDNLFAYAVTDVARGQPAPECRKATSVALMYKHLITFASCKDCPLKDSRHDGY